MADNDLKISLGLDTSAYKSGVADAIRETKSAFDGVKTNIRAAGSEITGVASGPLSTLRDSLAGIGIIGAAAFAAVVAGIRAVVLSTADLTGKTAENAATLNISVTQAGALDTALKKLGSSASDYVSATQQLGQHVRTNEAAVNSMGVTTRNADGSYRALNDIMADALKTLGEYKAGTDRTLASQQLFGGSTKNVTQMLGLNADALKAALEEQRALGLVVGVESVAAYNEFKSATTGAGNVLSGLGKTIGDAFMPVVSKMLEWFRDIGPAAISVFRVALGALVSVFWGLYSAINIVWESVKALADTFLVVTGRIGQAVAAIASGDFTGAAAAFDGMGDEISTRWSKRMDAVVAAARKAHDEIVNAFTTDTESGAPAAAGGKTFTPYAKPKKAKKESSADLDVVNPSAPVEWARHVAEEQRRIEMDNVAARTQLAMMALDAKRQQFDEENRLGLHSEAEQLQAAKDFEAERYNIEAQGLQDRRVLSLADAAEYTRALNDEKIAAKAHSIALQQIDNTTSANKKAMFDSMRSGFDSVLQTFFQGSMTIGNAIRGLMKSVLDSITNMLASMTAKWAVAHLQKMLMTKQEIAADAAGAAVGAAKSAASIPYVGWAIAIGAAATVFAAMGKYSAAGGFDVPAGLNPVTQLHAREMVLPASIADPLRNMVAGGGQGGGNIQHVHINAIDARSLSRRLSQHNGGAVRAALRSLIRSQGMTSP